MTLIRRNTHWIVALIGIVSLAYAAGMMHERLPGLGISQAAPVAPQPASAAEMSNAFRHAAREALPGMVSIETRGKVAVRGGANGSEVDPDDAFEGSPFGELFKGDPRLKEFFRRGGGPRQMPRSHGMGSGFVIDPAGIILTANHVVADAESVKVKLHDGREFMATDVKTDPRTDVAIVRIQPDGKLPAIHLGNSDGLEIGDWVLAIGSPFGLDATVTAGIISAKGRGAGLTEREDFLQTDAAINPGNSGGPLINLAGEVVGINTAISTRSGGYDGVGFAVPINLARWVADQLIEKGSVTRAYLGVGIQPVDSELSKQFNIPVGKGAIVTQVFPDSPAAAAKILPGDLVIKFNGKDVHGSRDLQGIVERLKAGDTYPMLILRDGKEMTLNVKTKEMPRDFSMATNPLVPNRPAPEAPKTDSFSDLGLGIESLTPETLQKLGYKPDTTGVLVSNVLDDSPASLAHLHQGMVIEMVGSMKVTSPEDFKEALKAGSLEKGVRMLVRTPRAAQFVVIRKDGK